MVLWYACVKYSIRDRLIEKWLGGGGWWEFAQGKKKKKKKNPKRQKRFKRNIRARAKKIQTPRGDRIKFVQDQNYPHPPLDL